MKFPCMVEKKYCKTPITVYVGNTELSEDGELIEVRGIATYCNLQMGAKASLTKDKEKIELSGIALFRGDLCPDMPVIASGRVIIDGQEYQINKGKKNYNPDGTINYTTLELI